MYDVTFPGGNGSDGDGSGNGEDGSDNGGGGNGNGGDGNGNGNGGIEQPTIPEASTLKDDFNYLWLIVIVVGIAILAAIAIIIAVLVRRSKEGDKEDIYTREMQQEDYFNSLQSRGISNQGYEQNFYDIDVKFR